MVGGYVTKNVKIWTSLPAKLHEEVKQIAREFGYTDAECFRELIRRGLLTFKSFEKIRLGKHIQKERGAILRVAKEIGDELDVESIPEKVKRGWAHNEIS